MSDKTCRFGNCSHSLSVRLVSQFHPQRFVIVTIVSLVVHTGARLFIYIAVWFNRHISLYAGMSNFTCTQHLGLYK